MINLEEPKITMLVGQESTTIDLFDSKSAKVFARVTLTNDQLASMLSRLGRVDCKIEVDNLDIIDKKMELMDFTFAIHEDMQGFKGSLNQKCLKELQDKGMGEWIPDKSYSSQDSFFTKENIRYAKTTIRRWI